MEQTASINIVLTKRSHTGVMAWLLAYLNLEQMLVYGVLVCCVRFLVLCLSDDCSVGIANNDQGDEASEGGIIQSTCNLSGIHTHIIKAQAFKL